MFVEEKRYLRKRKIVEKPIIASYVFVHIAKEHYVFVLKTMGVGSFLKIGNEIYPIPAEEIEILRKVVGEFDFDEVNISTLVMLEGDEVEIIRGKLTGIRGVVIESDKNNNIVVQMQNLGVALTFEIEAKYLQKC